MGHWAYGALEKERGWGLVLCLEGTGSAGVRNTGVRGRGVRNTGVRGPGVRSKSKTTRDAVALQSAPSDRGLVLTQPPPGSAPGWCCLCLPPESLPRISFAPQPCSCTACSLGQGFSHWQVILQAEGSVSSPSGFHVPSDPGCLLSLHYTTRMDTFLPSPLSLCPHNCRWQPGWAWGWYFIDTAVWQFVICTITDFIFAKNSLLF